MIARRRLLLGGCAGLALASCRRAAPGGGSGGDPDSGPRDIGSGDSGDTDPGSADTAPACDTGGSVDGWVEIPLAAYPELKAPGGWAWVDAPEELLVLVVAHVSEGCFVALWRICSHGACELSWEAASGGAVCPCHGSVFAEDGSVLVGPATSPVRAFPVVRRGDALFVGR